MSLCATAVLHLCNGLLLQLESSTLCSPWYVSRKLPIPRCMLSYHMLLKKQLDWDMTLPSAEAVAAAFMTAQQQQQQQSIARSTLLVHQQNMLGFWTYAPYMQNG